MKIDNTTKLSVQIGGIDTTTPETTVQDGKCETIHNMRYAAGGWRNVHDFAKKHTLKDSPYTIVYHHPADADNRYIAVRDDIESVEYYAWKVDDELFYSKVAPDNIKVGDIIYTAIYPEEGPVEMYPAMYVQGVLDNGIKLSYIQTNDEQLYGWSHKRIFKATYYTTSERPIRDDIIYISQPYDLVKDYLTVLYTRVLDDGGIRIGYIGDSAYQLYAYRERTSHNVYLRTARSNPQAGDAIYHYDGANGVWAYDKNMPDLFGTLLSIEELDDFDVLRVRRHTAPRLYAYTILTDDGIIKPVYSTSEPFTFGGKILVQEQQTFVGIADIVTIGMTDPDTYVLTVNYEGKEQEWRLSRLTSNQDITADMLYAFQSSIHATLYLAKSIPSRGDVVYMQDKASISAAGVITNVTPVENTTNSFIISFTTSTSAQEDVTITRIVSFDIDYIATIEVVRDTTYDVWANTSLLGPIYRANKHDKQNVVGKGMHTANMDIFASGKIFARVEIRDDGSFIVIEDITSPIDAEYKLSHFGNVLILNDCSRRKLLYYILSKKEDKYAQFDTSAVSIDSTIRHIEQSDMIFTNSILVWYDIFQEKTSLFQYLRTAGDTDTDVVPFEIYEAQNGKGYWRGEFAYFIALRMEDGQVIYTSPISIFSTRTEPHGGQGYPVTLKRVEIGDAKFPLSLCSEYDGALDALNVNGTYAISRYLLLAQPHLIVDVTNIPASAPLSIAIYATRIHPLFDSDALAIPSTDLLLEPFYLLAELDDSHIVNMWDNHIEYKLILHYDMFRGIESNIIYTPTDVFNNIYAANTMEYNNRLHLLDVELQTNVVEAHTDFDLDDSTGDEDESYRQNIIVDAKHNDRQFNMIIKSPMPHRAFAVNQPSLITFRGNINSFRFAKVEGTLSISRYDDLILKYSQSLNISYYNNIIPSEELYASFNAPLGDKYRMISFRKKNNDTIAPLKLQVIIRNANRIQASEVNNCFVYPYEASYRVGSETSRIIAANSVAIEMSDSKFGEFPLYVFTTEGIFAMQSGTETLYSAIIPLTYDKIINPHTLAINYNVLFVTKRGLMSLSSRGVAQVSPELNDQSGNIPEWLKTAELIYCPKTDEVLATDLANERAFVFSVQNRVWSSRDMRNGRLINGNEMVLDGEAILNVADENDAPNAVLCRIVTRAIKLNSLEWKRIYALIARLVANKEQTVRIMLYGSRDAKQWAALREVNIATDKDIRLLHISATIRYIKIAIDFDIAEPIDIALLGFDFEYALRHVNKLR